MHGFQPRCPVREHFADISIESYWCFHCCLFLLPGMERTSAEWIKKKKKKTQTFVILIGRQSHRALHRGTIVPLSIPPTLARSGQYSNTLSGVPGQPGKRWQSPHKCQPEHPQSEQGLQGIPEGFSLPLVADLQ